MTENYDGLVVGAGPNGLAAGITLAQAGLPVLMLEGSSTIGGGLRSAELTLPGYIHDVCSAVHPLGKASAFFRSLPLREHGVEWIEPSAPLAHPFDDGSAALLERSVEETSQGLGEDAKAYRRLMTPLVENWDKLEEDLLAPWHFPHHPLLFGRFGLLGMRSAKGLAHSWFSGRNAQALFGGLAAHSILPLDRPFTASFALILGLLGHAVGWPFPKGGSQVIANALHSIFVSLGGKVITNHRVECLEALPHSRVQLFDVTPKQLLQIVQKGFSASYRRRLDRYRYGPGVFKIDWALHCPIPWKAQACKRAGTVHLGGTLAEIIDSEAAVWRKEHPEKPFTLVAQQSLFDATRAPAGNQTAWAYCHVPNGSNYDMSERIEAQLERFAPGFRDCVRMRSCRTAREMEVYNPNYVGGDINGGVQDFNQLFTRPLLQWNPYATPIRHLFLCSSSTPPGGGVHGLCGYYAARSALKEAL